MSRKNDIADAVYDVLRLLQLSGEIVTTDLRSPDPESGSRFYNRVYRRQRLEDAGINCEFPCFVVYTGGIAETNPNSRSMTDDIGYGIGVALLISADSIQDDDAWETWREAMMDAFLNKRLSAVTQVVRCTIEPGPGLSEASPLYGMIRGNDIIRCLYQRART